MRLVGSGLILVALVVTGCKGKTEIKPDPKVVESLENCQRSAKDAAQLRKDLEARVAELEQNTGEVVVAIQGDGPDGAILKITGKGPNARVGGGTGVAGNAKDEELYRTFIASVKKSRSAIQQCYRRALKNDTRLQARTVTVSINVNYNVAGKVLNSDSSPRISDNFNRCMQSIAKRWGLPAMPKPARFKAPLTLTPES